MLFWPPLTLVHGPIHTHTHTPPTCTDTQHGTQLHTYAHVHTIVLTCLNKKQAAPSSHYLSQHSIRKKC